MDEDTRALLIDAYQALGEYGIHRMMCASRTREKNDPARHRPCDCGLAAIKSRLRKVAKPPNGDPPGE